MWAIIWAFLPTWCWGSRRVSSTSQVLIKPLLVSHLLMFLWQKQVTGPNPESVLEVITQWHRPRRPLICQSNTETKMYPPKPHTLRHWRIATTELLLFWLSARICSVSWSYFILYRQSHLSLLFLTLSAISTSIQIGTGLSRFLPFGDLY